METGSSLLETTLSIGSLNSFKNEFFSESLPDAGILLQYNFSNDFDGVRQFPETINSNFNNISCCQREIISGNKTCSG